MLCSTACAILNPYVNLFGIFSAVTTFIMLTFAIIGIQQLKNSRTNDEAGYVKLKIGKACITAFAIICAMTCVINNGISSTLTLFSTTPAFDILGIYHDTGLCKCFVLMQFIYHFTALIAVIIYRKYIFLKLLTINPANLKPIERSKIL